MTAAVTPSDLQIAVRKVSSAERALEQHEADLAQLRREGRPSGPAALKVAELKTALASARAELKKLLNV